MNETPENRLKRLRLRSWRRGTKEMDLILGRYADACLASLSAPDLHAYEVLMQENDHDLYQWYSGQASLPAELQPAMSRIKLHFRQNRNEISE